MKFLALALLALTAVASAKLSNLEDVIDLEDITAYGYLTKIGLPAADRILSAEQAPPGPIHGRIVGGSQSYVGQYPYQAGLLVNFPAGRAVCGGSLISDNRVLTAAHCWSDGQSQGSSITVVLGTTTLFAGGTRVTTTNVVVHESWNPNLVRNDIAMIGLPSAVTLSHRIAVIALPSGTQLDESYVGETATATGFGVTRDEGRVSGGQSYVSLSVITNDVCRTTFPTLLQDSNICTSGADGKSTCHGDSGGPLAVVRNNKALLIGITSFGSSRGCQAGCPAAFTRVTTYISWINNHL